MKRTQKLIFTEHVKEISVGLRHADTKKQHQQALQCRKSKQRLFSLSDSIQCPTRLYTIKTYEMET